MFDVGLPELFIIAVLAIVVVGPKDLPKVMRSVMKMIKKVREMGSEFQTGLKRMADEVELDAVTRKLNETGRSIMEDTKPAVDPSAEFSDYEEFDYNEYDYEGGGHDPTPDTDKKAETDDAAAEPANETSEEAELTEKAPDIIPEDEPAAEPVSEENQVEEAQAESKTDDR